MLTTYLLDTNMVSYIITGYSPAARQRMLRLSEDEICCVSTITEAELRFGLAKRPKAVAAEARALLDSFLASVRVLPWGREEAESYGVLRAKLEAVGKPLSNMDMLIAAHAVALNAVLVSHDGDFARVEDLSASVDWATDL
jgi:tRNA(fMet)-specific endonuclease VapC